MVVGNSVTDKMTTFTRTQALHVSASMPEMEQKEAVLASKEGTPVENEKEPSATAPKPASKPRPKKGAPHGKEGILSPVVLAAKAIMGDEQFNKLRAKIISLHSDVIEGFVVDNSDTAFGQAVLKRLFALADQDQNGSIEETELEQALRTLGFDWLKDKQVNGIFQRADKNENGRLELEEWLAEAPKTLRTNLIKLAKKNGGELGLLA